MTKAPVFPNAKVPSDLSSIYVPRTPSPIVVVTVVAKRAPIDIGKRAPTEKLKAPFQPVITTVCQVIKYLLVYHQFLYQ